MLERAHTLLQQMLGPGAMFRDGQWETIQALVEQRARVLLVQATGWGKSLVYFIATKLLREQGAGPTLLISPLLALMRNQVEMAERIGIHAFSINSSNPDDWGAIEAALAADQCDVLLVSPERLANERFMTKTLPAISTDIGLFVVDEAHCISDWGHDFRPDYRRLGHILRGLTPSVPVLATTATANDRVVADIVSQLGEDLRVARGPLARPSLRIQTIRLADRAARLAWLAEHLPKLPGSGIVYCLTVADCRRVSEWLASRGIDAPAYHGDLGSEERAALEQRLLRNEVKALVATVALGMGFDKPDLGFVVHYQRPGSVVSYYQQIGRAGRAIHDAYAVLLHGNEDDEIQDYFIRNAFPGTDRQREVLTVLEASAGLGLNEILARVNLSRARVEQCLKLLEIEGAVVRDGSLYVRTVNPWTPDEEHSRQITAGRYRELDRMRAFVDAATCLMEFVARELDDPWARPCGRCAVCCGLLVPTTVDPALVREAIAFLGHETLTIEPKRQWPAGAIPGRHGRIPAELRNAEGRALCVYGDPGWGEAVQLGKYVAGHYSDELVQAAAELVRERWRPQPPPAWVTAVPSLRRPRLVGSFAERLAVALGLPFYPVLEQVQEVPEQKVMENSAHQAANVAAAFRVSASNLPPAPVLLVDDIVTSGWTLAVCGMFLREGGSGPVHPFALATAAGRTL